LLWDKRAEIAVGATLRATFWEFRGIPIATALDHFPLVRMQEDGAPIDPN
jgi:hypothetical protein